MTARIAIAVFVFLGATAVRSRPAEPTESELKLRFSDTVHPILKTYCFSCHDSEKQKGKLDLTPYSTMDLVVQNYRLWEIVLERLSAKEMPPEEAKSQPTPAARQAVIDWIHAMRKHEATRNAGDPGPVLARRLSNAEYDYSIRDLTGVDIRPTQEFPVDPANEAGFDNSGESLTMSPALLNKYLEAARRVAEHLVLKPNGFVFAPHPATTETDRDKYCVKRIVDFYERQPTNLAAYFQAAWQFKYRATLGKAHLSMSEVAAAERLSGKYLTNIWFILTENQNVTGPIAKLQEMWRALPQPGIEPSSVREDCERMAAFVTQLRLKVRPEFKNLTLRGISSGSQPLVLWKNRQYATNRMSYRREVLEPAQNPSADAKANPVEASSKLQANSVKASASIGTEAATKSVRDLVDEALVVPADEAMRAEYESALARFCRVFPDAFYVSERGRVFLQKDEGDRGRLLSAGFHLMVGYFRDDAPLYDLILDQQGQDEIDSLWRELNFITSAPMRQYKDFIFFERAEPPRFMQGAEFDFARSEDKDATSVAKINQLAAAYLAKVRRNVAEDHPVIPAMEYYFKSMADEIRWVERARLAATPSHLQSLQEFAERAYRRPLLQTERDDLSAFYHSLRENEGLEHEEAIRDSVVSILMSPHFCFRIDLAEAGGAVSQKPSTGLTPSARTQKVAPLSDYSLASRLSYFLWSSLPDAELLDHARAGDLHVPDVLVSQARRMLTDDRIRGLATEFGGNWLDFRRFEEHNSVDRERFKSFNNDLRQAMFEEPVRFFVDLLREDRSVLDFLYAKHTFVNSLLAQHYGIPAPASVTNAWFRIENADRYQRGGLLPMSVFLTKNAPGLRTSPVKRGYWVIRRLLGEHVPPPPPKVPELPNDETKLGTLTLRETLARHREDKSCAGCHERFDAIGLVFEGYGPIGELRERDFAGRAVDTHATFPGGPEGTGLDGLRDYLRDHRQEEFLDNLCRKLLAYALGRNLLLSDDGTIHDMRAKLSSNHYRFGALIESIVTSPQFLNKRSHDELTRN